jgi:predicted Zn-dependent peptidase
MEDHELPLITVDARIRTGANYEPADKVGLAPLTGTVQRSGGTLRQSGDQIDDFLAARAASIETRIGDDSGYASMDCLKQDFDEVFKVFGEVLRMPVFAQDKLEVAKVAANTRIARRNDSVGSITFRELNRLVYGPESPLARNTEYATIQAITREDLVSWHKQYYQPNNVLLGVVGDFDPRVMREKIEATFGDWPGGAAFTPPPVSYRHQPAPGYYFIEKPDVNQANIVLGHLGIETRNLDYFAIEVMNEVLGGGFSSRLFSSVRSKQGLAYSVYGSVGSDYYQPGLFRGGLQTKSGSTVKALAALRTEIQGMIDNPPSETELKRAKDSILNSFIFNYDSRAKLLSQQMTYEFYGLPSDFLEQYRDKIEKVQVADVSRVAKQYIHPDQFAILVVGKSDDFDQPLTTLGKVTTLDITIPPAPNHTQKIGKNASSVEQGRDIWARLVKSMGGDRLKKTKSFRGVATVLLKMREQPLSFKQTTTMVFPDRLRQVTTTQMGDQILVINGTEGFTVTGDKVQPLPASSLQDQIKEQSRSLQYLLHYYDDPSLEVLAAGQEQVDGTNCNVLAVSFKGVDTRLWVTPDDKVIRQSYSGTNPVTHAPGLVENRLSDYRFEAGLLIPHKQIRSVDSQESMVITIDSFLVNPFVDLKLFSKPALPLVPAH